MKGKVSMVVLLLFVVAGLVSTGYAYSSTLVNQDNPGTVTINYIEMTSTSNVNISVGGDGSDHELVFSADGASPSYFEMDYKRVGGSGNKISFIVSFSGGSQLAGTTFLVSLSKGGNTVSGSVILDGEGNGTIAGLVMDLSESKQTVKLSGIIQTLQSKTLDVKNIRISVEGYPIGGA